MQGKVLGFDTNSAEGMISAEDGRRYAFTPADWRHRSPPQSGQRVDFEAQDGRATGIYVTGGGAMTADKNRFVAALLAFFLGTLGLHKFYLGQVRAGIIMLCVAVFGSILFGVPTAIIAVIALIECIIYLATPDEAFERKYVEGHTAWF
ncbi:TM2 domain-containing protein [Sphingomonas sp. PAMC 26617]|uniref:TM2 domain-containing protein n=1 Tax=Sphingomonas sp. PAMC 26617 TaxID=1112216 RepID=UPI00028A2094|nr:TM2 domain-containing protein [Sphingomonas sp. PAMC 26617]